MNMKIIRDFLIILLMLIILLIPNISKGIEIIDSIQIADTSGSFDLGNLDKYKGDPTDSASFNSKVSKIFSIIRNIGIIIAVVILIVIGIKYMLESAEGKAEYAKAMIPYIIGAAILFSGSILPELIYNLVTQISV